MNTKLQDQITHLGEHYSRLTDMPLTHRGVVNPREFAWHQWIKAGFTEADLTLVVGWLKTRIRAKVRNPECLKFSNLIADPFKFEEELALARAEKRNAKPARDARQVVLAQARPVVCEPVTTMTAKPIGEYIAALREAAQ